MSGTPSLPPDEVLFEQAACGLVVTNTNGIILRANTTFCRWLDQDEATLTGQRRVQEFFTMGGRVFYQTHCGPMLHIRSQGDLGIGLALVRGLVALHGGSISANSEGVGKGSEFSVRLPTLDLPLQASAASPQGSTARRGRIMVVDDNVDAAVSMTMALELIGHETLAVHDGAAALQAAASFLPQVILLDIGLPGQNGYEVARQIRHMPWGRDVLLVAATGWHQQSDKQLAQDAGFDRHLTKPVDFGKLQAMLSQDRT